MAPEKSTLDGLRIDRDQRPPGTRVRWVLLVVVVLVIALAAGWALMRPQAAVVRTALADEVELGGASTVLNASGYVTARRQATVSSKVTAKVVEVLIEEGLEVSEGQVLARLDSSNVDVSLRLAEAQLAAARSALAETEVRIHEAELDLTRMQDLVEKEVASQAELDSAQAELDSFEARLGTQRDQVAVAEQEVAVWRQQKEDSIIRAPFAGVVVTKDAQPGEMISPVSAGGGFTRTGIGTVVDMSSLEIEVDVNESYIKRVFPGQPVSATLDAYPEWQIPAHVIAIIPTADRQKATVQVRIGFEELDPRILPDMGVKVAFQEEHDSTSPRRAVVVPSSAIRHENGRDVVFVVKNTSVERRAVRVGATTAGAVEVEVGLAAGEAVVVEGPEELRDGDVVEVKG